MSDIFSSSDFFFNDLIPLLCRLTFIKDDILKLQLEFTASKIETASSVEEFEIVLDKVNSVSYALSQVQYYSSRNINLESKEGLIESVLDSLDILISFIKKDIFLCKEIQNEEDERKNNIKRLENEEDTQSSMYKCVVKKERFSNR